MCPQLKQKLTLSPLLKNQQIKNKYQIQITKLAEFTAQPNNKKRKEPIQTSNHTDKQILTTFKQPKITQEPKTAIQKFIAQENQSILSKNDIQNVIESNNLFPPEIPVKSAIGKYGLMWPRGLAFIHDAAPLLDSYSRVGCPTDCGPQWTETHIIAAIKRGAHPSANKPNARRYLINQTMEKVKENFARIVKWKDIKQNIPPNLKISPIAMIPHKSRDFRSILDLSFQIRLKGKRQPSVNQTTNKLAPQKAMAGLGRALQRIIITLADNHNKNKPFKFAKCDIKDGFWRMIVSETDSWNFCYILPPPSKTTPIDEIEIIVPNSLQMGWCESPPFFCAATETGRDIISELYNRLDQLPPHPMEHWMLDNTNTNTTSVTTKATTPASKEPTTTNLIEVYVDDFISATNQLDNKHLTQISRAVLHGIHSIFPPTNISNHCGGDPISEKKMEKGDGRWDFKKEILGWIFDGNEFTIFLPPEKSKKVQIAIKHLAKKKTATLHEWQQIMGKLNHACIGLPSGRGLLSPLNNAMKGGPEIITLKPPTIQALIDWCILIQRISSRPTSVKELTPGLPWFIGYVDASKFGVGGVWIPGSFYIKPTVWRILWPADIQKALVSAQNKDGTISISDLEMAGVLLAWLVLENICPTNLQHSHVGIFCDNTPAVAWATRLASSKSKIGGHLCRALALRQHVHRSSPLLTVSIAGVNNDMADVASRAAKNTAANISQSNFLALFKSKFPLPKQHSWHLYQLPDKWSSRMTSCLRGTPLTMASWTKLPNQGKNTGLTGLNTQTHSTKTPSSNTSPKCNNLSSSQLSLRGSGQVTSAEAIESEFQPSLRLSRPSPRPSNWLESKAQSTKQKGYTKSQWQGSWKGTDERTHPPSHSLLFPSAYQQKCKQQDTPKDATSKKPSET